MILLCYWTKLPGHFIHFFTTYTPQEQQALLFIVHSKPVVSRLDSLGLILEKPKITKLQLPTALMCFSDGTSQGRISPACREWIGAAAEEQSCTTSQNAPMPPAGLALLCQHKVWPGRQAQSQRAGAGNKEEIILPLQAPPNPFPLTATAVC